MKNKTIIEVARAKLQADHPDLSEDSLAQIASWAEFGPPSYQWQPMKALYARREIKRTLEQLAQANIVARISRLEEELDTMRADALALSKLNQDGKIVSRNSEE